MAPRTPGDQAGGKVRGGDGGSSPKPKPGFHPSPGENPVIGADWVHEGEDDPRTWDPTMNSTSSPTKKLKTIPKMTKTGQHQEVKHPDIKPAAIGRGLHNVLLGG